MITLLTDFGYKDPYVGIIKGVILGINPHVKIIDISHDISPQNVDEAAYMLKRSYLFFPTNTIHVVIVDPGVGSRRSVLAVNGGGYTFLAPDNGILKYIFDAYPECQVVQVTNREYFPEQISATFHGRDVFAPVAAHLSLGIPFSDLGNLFDLYQRGSVPSLEINEGCILGQVIYMDGFGNVVTNIGDDVLNGKSIESIEIKNTKIDHLVRSYSDVSQGELLAYVGSDNTLEISVNQGNAKSYLGVQIGESVKILFKRSLK